MLIFQVEPFTFLPDVDCCIDIAGFSVAATAVIGAFTEFHFRGNVTALTAKARTGEITTDFLQMFPAFFEFVVQHLDKLVPAVIISALSQFCLSDQLLYGNVFNADKVIAAGQMPAQFMLKIFSLISTLLHLARDSNTLLSVIAAASPAFCQFSLFSGQFFQLFLVIMGIFR